MIILSEDTSYYFIVWDGNVHAFDTNKKALEEYAKTLEEPVHVVHESDLFKLVDVMKSIRG